MHLIMPTGLVLQQHGELLQIDMASLKIVLSGNSPQIDDFQILSQCQHDLVNIRKLIAGGVYPDAVGIAFQGPDGSIGRRDRLPGCHHRQCRVEMPGVSVQKQEPPSVEFGFLQLLV